MEYTDVSKSSDEAEAPVSPGSQEPASEPSAAEGKASDAVAVLLSVVPGLGHIYKGHRLVGALLIFAGTPVAVGLALLAATGTAGFALALLPIYWIGVMLHVYSIDDRVPAAKADDGEQF